MNFKERAIGKMEREGWMCAQKENKIIDWECTRGKYTIGLRIKKHGRILTQEWERLRKYGEKHSMHILYIHETSEHELSFVRVYPKRI